MSTAEKDTMTILDPRALGATGLTVTELGFGASPIGGNPGLYGHDVSEDEAIQTVLRAFAGPLNVIDTSNNYGEGRSEERIGKAIRINGGIPSGFLVATKVDADPATGRFDRERVLRSFDESTARLGVDTIDLLHLHDPEHHLTLGEALDESGAIEGLRELVDSGRVRALGLAGGVAAEMSNYVATGLFDVLLTHNRYSLVDRTADELINQAAARGMGIINAAPFGGGLLARAPRRDDRYAYGSGTVEQVRAAASMHAVLEPLGIPLGAAALQFSTLDPRIHVTLVGASSPSRIDENLNLLGIDIPDDVWARLDALVPAREYWIND